MIVQSAKGILFKMKIQRYKKDSVITYALGATVAMEFLNFRPEAVEEIFLHPAFDSADTIEKIRSVCTSRNIPVTTDGKAFNIVSQKENCFVFAVLRKWEDHLEKGSHVVLVNPSNAGNLGTIMRSCLGFGLNDIAIVTPAVDRFDPKTVRASMGSLARLRVELFVDYGEYRERFPENHEYPFMLDGSILLQEAEIEAPFSLIMGNEATGLPPEFREIGQPVRIGHTDRIDSLNLPIATSIGLYEATKNSGLF